MGRLVGFGLAANMPCSVFITTPVNSYITTHNNMTDTGPAIEENTQ